MSKAHAGSQADRCGFCRELNRIYARYLYLPTRATEQAIEDLFDKSERVGRLHRNYRARRPRWTKA